METSQHLPAGFVLNGIYRIERVLGQGGFGITYLAVDTTLDRKVAIKEFFPKDYCTRQGDTSRVTLGTASSEEFINELRAKFLKEARNIAKLDYPNIIRIITQFEANGTAYYVMDYIEGTSLNDLIATRGPMNEQVALANIEWIGNALEYIHAKKINHLDVKPSNVMIRRSDNLPILIDFGLSKQYDAAGQQTSHTPTGISYGYAPLEQYDRAGLSEFSPETDIYSLAATLYYMMTGATPPPATALIESGITFPESIPQHLHHVIAKAMASNRANRYHSVSEFLYALKHARETDPGATRINPGGSGTYGLNGPHDPSGANNQGNNSYPAPAVKKKGWIKWVAIAAGTVTACAVAFFIFKTADFNRQPAQTDVFPGEEPIEVPVYTNPDPVVLGSTFECENSSGVKITYRITSSRTVEVAKGNYSGTVEIPSIVEQGNNKYYVTAIGDEAFYISSATDVKIPLSVTSIGRKAFYISDIKEIKIPNSVTEIAEDAFHSCDKLRLVVMGNSVKTIGPKAFAHSNEIQTVVLSPSLEVIGNGSFMFCKKLENVVMSPSLTVISDSAFYACEELRNIQIPSATKLIGNLSFQGCDKMKSIIVPRTIERVGNGAFSFSENLQSIYLSGTPTYGTGLIQCDNELSGIYTTMKEDDDGLFELFSIPDYRRDHIKIVHVSPGSILATLLNL